MEKARTIHCNVKFYNEERKMNNHFRVHGIKRDGSGLTKKFTRYDYIDTYFASHIGDFRFNLTPHGLREFIYSQITKSKFCVVLATKNDEHVRTLSWDEIYEKVNNKLSELLTAGKLELERRLTNAKNELSELELEYKVSDKTTLQFILIDQPKLEKQFVSTFNNLSELESDLADEKYGKYVNGFYYMTRDVLVSADDFVL